ncbi:MAG TPA: SHOCT domain-containing protein [Streptosporangiaceae bacterium]|jgi:membrane protease subunit (stomatin/prohibitin family)
MFVRRRPLLRAAVVGGGAYVAGKKMGQRQEQQTSQEQQTGQDGGQGQASVPSQARSGESAQQSVSDQLAKLSTLHQQGALNDSEFATAKAKLLGS